MSEYTYRLNFYPITDFTGITAWLEAMAAKGWMLDRIGPHLWKFRRAEPRRVRFSVIYLAIDSNLLTPELPPEAVGLQELCAGTGWHWVASAYQMQIFANEAPDPLPLETDPVAQVQHIHRAMMRHILPRNLLTLVIAVILAGFSFSALSWDRIFTDKPSLLLLGVSSLILVLLLVLDMLTYFLWYHRAAEAASSGTLAPSVSFPAVYIAITALLIVLALCWLFTAGADSALPFLFNFVLIFLVQSIAGLMRRKSDSSR